MTTADSGVAVDWTVSSRAPRQGDYASLVGPAWCDLPLRTQARFAHQREMACYRGRVVRSECTLAGRLLRQLGRLFGSPLPLDTTVGPAAVIVMAVGNGSSAWTRIYRRRHGRGQAIRSVKRFCGPTGLEEYLGGGICMALRASAANGSLVFESDGYYLAIGSRRLPLPPWLAPGRLRVRHTELAAPCFRFTMELTHPLFGLLVRQEAVFEDSP